MRGTTIVLEYEVHDRQEAHVVTVVEDPRGPLEMKKMRLQVAFGPCRKCKEASRMSGGLITECLNHERSLYGKALRG